MPRKDAPPQAPNFMDLYRSGALNDFFDLAPGDVEGALRVPRPADRPALAAAMRAHARRWDAPKAVFDALDRLEHPNSRTVSTGQQTGLLLGPTFSLSKAITALKLAQRLDTEERPVVAVFWLASQDHDTAEIDHAYLLDGEERLHRAGVELPADVAAGRASIEPQMLNAVATTFDAMRPLPPHRDEVEGLLRDTADRAINFADWFAGLMYRLLGSQGLLLFDPMDPGCAPLLYAALAKEIAAPEVGPEAINAAGSSLRRLGVEPQLGRGADATNLFLEVEGAGLPRRSLLRRKGNGFHVENQSLTAAEVLNRLERDSACLTPAAGLRPIVQDTVLPTAINVLGPGELRYVAQLRGVYAAHAVPMPLAWPRATATLLEPPVARILDRYGITARAFQADPQGCLERVLLERSGHGARFRQTADELERSIDALLTEVQAIDPTLGGTVERGRTHLEMTLARLRGKTARALSAHDAISRGQFQRLADHLLPLQQPSERLLSPLGHMLKFGIEPVLELFLSLEPEGDQELRI